MFVIAAVHTVVGLAAFGFLLEESYMPERTDDSKMTATPLTRVLGILGIAASLVMAVLGLFISPPDVVQGEAVRMLYLHVPSIWIAYGSFVSNFHLEFAVPS